MAMKKVAVVVLESANGDSIEFYVLHDTICKMYEALTEDDNGEDDDDCDPVQAIPLMRLNSCPTECAFVSHQGNMLIVGGSMLSQHLSEKLEEEYDRRSPDFPFEFDYDHAVERAKKILPFDEILETVHAEYPHDNSLLSLRGWDFDSIDSCGSNRVRAFQMQKFVDDKQKPGISSNLDDDIIPIYWKSYPCLNTPRYSCHLLNCNGNLYALGGNDIKDRAITGNFLEVFLHGQWSPILLSPSIITFGTYFLSAAVGNAILIGSANHTSFILLKFPEPDQVSVENLDIEFPVEFLDGCDRVPGIVLNNQVTWDETIVVWHDEAEKCIRGVHLGEKKHFDFNLVDEKIVITTRNNYSWESRTTVKLIGFGDGTLGVIYFGDELCSDPSAKEEDPFLTLLRDYRFVRFGIISDSNDLDFPIKTKFISSHKFYADSDMNIQEAFVMDVCIPDT